MKIVILFLVSMLSLSLGQFDVADVRHRAVIQSAAQEAQLPPNLLNPFYKDPRIRSMLARSSWFGPGEKPVYNREADNISRRNIFIVLNHAGLLPQQQQ